MFVHDISFVGVVTYLKTLPCFIIQISGHDFSRICRRAAGKCRGFLPHQGEPTAARDPHLGPKVPERPESFVFLKSRVKLYICFFAFNTSLLLHLDPGSGTRLLTTGCSTMGSTLSGRKGLSQSMTWSQTRSSPYTSRQRRRSTSPR